MRRSKFTEEQLCFCAEAREDRSPGWHFQCDVLQMVEEEWKVGALGDLGIVAVGLGAFDQATYAMC